MLHCILNRMCEVIQRINAPLVANAVMGCVNNTVDCRIAHVHVRRCHINLCAQRLCTLLVLARTHFLKQAQVFLDRAVTIRAVFARLGQAAAICAHLFLRQITDVCFALLNQVLCALVALVKVIRAVEDAAGRLRTGQPLNILQNGLYILIVLTHRIGIVKAQIKQTVVFLCNRPVDVNRLCRANVQIAVRLRRKTRVNSFGQTVCNVFINDFMQKIRCKFHCCSPFF